MGFVATNLFCFAIFYKIEYAFAIHQKIIESFRMYAKQVPERHSGVAEKTFAPIKGRKV